jgi:hypothetical protein|tara:strand:- start:332 stop:808 length:477 start_codon:yes stop_codon:yes gene_type:complete
MNIFYLDEDPEVAAIVQYNKHVVKMILESAQMLCTAHRYYGNDDVPYKTAHLNHPSTIWVRQNTKHYFWLYKHMLALGEEYTHRYGKVHMSITKCKEPLQLAPINMPTYKFEQPPQCMPDEFKSDCAIHAYWAYYIGEKHVVAAKDEMIYELNPAIAV